jgi:histidine triad (HIT) family protein
MIELEEKPRRNGGEKCIFCEIAAHRAPADIILEDSLTIAFMDIHPASNGHSLVIPKKHFRNLFDIDDSTLQAVILTTRRIACATREALKTDGMNIMQSNEKAGFQDVFHFHFHIIPRWLEDEYFMIWNRKRGDTDIIRKTAVGIRRELKNLEFFQ